MQKISVCLLWILALALAHGQEGNLPTDFRQHNLTYLGTKLFNAAMLPHWESPNSLLLWTRWQWQDIDGDPSTLFVNYTHQIDSLSSFGAGFLQHNTGVFVNTGGQLNYSRAFQLVDGIRLLAGMNIFVFQQNVADEQFLGLGQADPSLLKAYEGFRTEFSPGLQLLIDRFRLGIAFENAFGFKFSGEGERDYLQNITGSLSYDFPIEWLGGGQDGFLRPMAYFRTSPGVDTQVGLHALLRAPKFWVQGGYNSFYGVSGGLGVTLARTVSIGGLMEFAVDRDLEGKNPSIEILASYRFGKTGPGKREVDPEKEQAQVLAQEEREQEAATKEMERARIQKERDSLESLAQWQITQRLLGERQRRDSMALVVQQRKRDSLTLAVQVRRKDSLMALASQKVELLPQEKFEEIQGEEGLEPGFYLIANVFGTKKYFDSFMKTLKGQGLQPKSFYRKSNNFNYVFLERYGTMEEARRARDSGFFGKYRDKTWIFRVRGL